jgi:cytochrome b6-f complex iron-sulfur subunit
MTLQTQLAPLPTTRRRALSWLLLFSVASTVSGVVGPILAYLLPAKQSQAYSGDPISVGAVGDFPVGTGKVVNVNNTPVIVVNTTAGGIKAFSAICTHLGCVVGYEQRKTVIRSPCHDGLFNPVTGDVVSGPPPRALPAYELTIKEEQVYIGKPLGRIFGT